MLYKLEIFVYRMILTSLDQLVNYGTDRGRTNKISTGCFSIHQMQSHFSSLRRKVIFVTNMPERKKERKKERMKVRKGRTNEYLFYLFLSPVNLCLISLFIAVELYNICH